MPATTFKKTSMMRQIERRFPGKTIAQIVALVFNRHGAYAPAADELGVSEDTLRLWMPEMGITVRTIAEVATAEVGA